MQSPMPQRTISLVNKILWTSTVVAVAGFLDATYLTVKHFLGTPIPCSILEGCEVVTTSAYSEIFGIPVALLGSIYYLAMLIWLVIIIERADKHALLRAWSYAAIAGFVASLGFVYIQLFILHAICLYCMGSALTSTLLFIAGMSVLKLSHSNDSSNPPLGSA